MIQKKICLVGQSAVGKTSLIKRFVKGIFDSKYLTSIGVKVDKKEVHIDDQNVMLLIWDIEGVDKYSALHERYLKGAFAYIVVVDVSRDNTEKTAAEIVERIKVLSNAPIIMAYNKSDLLELPEHMELEKKIESNQENYSLITSAKDGRGVNSMFEHIAILATSGAPNE